NDLHNAVEALVRSKMYNPEDPAAYLKLRRLYLQLNEFEKALKVQSQLQSLKNAPPLDAEAYAAYGQIFIAKKDYVRAERFYLKSIEENPNQPELYLQLARIYKLQNRIDKVMQNYEKYLELRPNDAYILSDLGYMFYKKRDIKNATLRLQKSLELAPHIPETHYYIAKLYAYIFKNYDFAINEYLKSQELGLNNNEINFHLAYSFYYSDEYKKALDKLLEFYNGDLSNIQLDTSIVDYNLANMYIFNNRYNEAVNKYNAVLASKEWDDKEKIILYNNIGLGYELANNSDSAISYYWKAIELKEHNLDKNNQDFLIGVSLKPKKNFNRILSNNPNITNLKDYLEWDLKNIEN
ncbi:MAG TPA: tetratricopeptide repeat protein, partial [bacterium]|nr:tetratricopeptide repeat protein [bacterium]